MDHHGKYPMGPMFLWLISQTELNQTKPQTPNLLQTLGYLQDCLVSLKAQERILISL